MIGLLSMHKVNSSFFLKVLPRAFLICLVCLSLVAFSSYTAPKASAEALTLSLTTAFLMLTIAVMATLGVTLTAPTIQDGIDYLTDPFLSFIQGKGYSSISDYLASVGITAVTQLAIPVFGAVNIVKTVYDVIAEFCTSFFADKEVVDNGDPVGDVGSNAYITLTQNPSANIVNPLSVSVVSDTVLHIISNNMYSTNNTLREQALVICVPVDTSVSTVSVRFSNVINNPNYGFWLYPYFSNYTSLSNYSGVTRYNVPQQTYSFYLSNSSHYQYLCFGVYVNANYGQHISFDISLSGQDFVGDSGFVINPSATVLSPPTVATGQTYSVPASGVSSTDTVDDAITASVQPLTTTGGLSTTGTVSGTAVPAEYEWLYEDTQAIRNNTNPHFDFIPSALGFDYLIWHYVVDMMSSVSASFALLGTFINNMPAAVLVFPFGVFALAITVALLRRFLS